MQLKNSDADKNELKILIVAGPNGAGKTTFAKEFLVSEANCPVFINADLIAAGLSPFDPSAASIKAARLMLNEIQERVDERSSFAFETTLSGRSYLKDIKEWQSLGYHVKLFFIMLPNVELAIDRVSQRVRQGGHDIPEKVIRRRYESGWKNFSESYNKVVDTWVLYNGAAQTPTIVEWGENER